LLEQPWEGFPAALYGRGSRENGDAHRQNSLGGSWGDLPANRCFADSGGTGKQPSKKNPKFPSEHNGGPSSFLSKKTYVAASFFTKKSAKRLILFIQATRYKLFTFEMLLQLVLNLH